MASLYEISHDYQQVMDMVYDPDIDIGAIFDTLELLEAEFHDKADGYAKIIRSITADVDAISAEAKRLNDRAKALRNRLDSLKSNLLEAMKSTGNTEFKTTLFSFAVRSSPPSVSIANESLVPDDYCKIIREPNKTAIKESLANDVPVPGCSLIRNEHLRIW